MCATDGDDDLTVQVNLDNLLTGLGNGELLQPNSVLGATVRRAAQYDRVLAENASLRNELCVLKQHQQANAHQHQLQPPPPPTPQQARSLFHEGYVLSLEQKCTSHGTELAHLQAQVDDKTRALVWQMQQHDGTLRTLRTLHDDQFSKFEQSHSIEILKLKSEQDDTLSTCKQSHSIEVRDLKTHHASTEARSDVRAEQKLQAQHEAFLSEQRAQHAAHQLALFEQHSILGLQHRQAEAALRAALEDRHTRQQQEARRDLINEIKENALHFVHGAPTYKALYSTGLARVDSSGNVMPGEQWHGCDGAHAQEADVDSPNSSLRDEDPFWLHQRVRKALHEQWTGFMQRCYAITGWDQHTTNHFSGAGGKAASIIAKMLRYNGPDGLAVPHGSIGFGSLLTAVLTSMPAHVMLLEESHKKTKSSLVAMLRKVVGPCAELDESLNGASQRKRRRERK